MKELISADQIQVAVVELAEKIEADYGDRPLTVLGVLTGSVILLADLIRHIDLPLKVGNSLPQRLRFVRGGRRYRACL